LLSIKALNSAKSLSEYLESAILIYFF